MTHTNSTLTVSDLDFDNIRENLKDFLSSQEQFKDYDFDGSNLSVLLDLLAYNTHYNSYYLNMVGNEMFLRTAQLRNNVVDRSQELGYTPRSARGASVSVDIQITPDDNPANILIPTKTKFTTVINDETLTFTNDIAYLVSPDTNGDFIATNSILVEGFPVTHKFTVSTTNPAQFIIPNINVDTSRLTVKVQENATSTTIDEYTLVTDITEVTGLSKVYFLEESDDRKYRIYFGDDIIGVKPKDGNIIIIDYFICNDIAGNGTKDYTSSGSIAGYTDIDITLNDSSLPASGGVEQESNESIKFNAPFHFETQNRLVTKKDYERVIIAENADFDAVSVWGGEENVPRRYGRVLIAVKPATGETITDNRKAQLIASLSTRNVLPIMPEIVDAEFLFLIPNVEVNYDPDQTTLSSGDITALVDAAINQFQQDNLDIFGSVFRYSKFIKTIDDADPSIISNETDIILQKRFVPTIGVVTKYTIIYNNPLQNGGTSGNITSTKFTFDGFTCSFIDDGKNNIDIVRSSGDAVIIVSAGVGTVDYVKGIIIISFSPQAVANGGVIELSAIPRDKDITPINEQILQITDSQIITVEGVSN